MRESFAGRLIIAIPQPRHGPRGQKPGGENEKLQNGGGARDAIETGEGKEDEAGQEAREEDRLHHIECVVNREVARYAVANAERRKRNQGAGQRDAPIEQDLRGNWGGREVGGGG